MSDLDVIALLLRDPFCGPMSAEIYADTPDAIILGAYLAPRDKKGRLIPEAVREKQAERRRKEREAEGRGEAVLTGRLSRARRELPSPESLEVPPECFTWASPNGRCLPGSYVVLWWQVWRSRPGQTTEGLMERWAREMSANGLRPGR